MAPARTTAGDPLSATFAALADPTRRAILARLAGGEATVGQLAEPFAISLPAITKHLKTLQRAGLVVQGREKQWRPCRLRPEPLKDVADWMEDYRALWEARLDRLGDYLDELQGTAAAAAPAAASPAPAPARIRRRRPRR